MNSTSNLEIGKKGILKGRKLKNVEVISMNDKYVTYLDLDTKKKNYIYKKDFISKFDSENLEKTILKNDSETKQSDKEEKVSKSEKKSNPEFTLVGIYKTNEPGRGVDETEDLTKKEIIGYRIRYNKKEYANMNFGYIGWPTDQLQQAKEQLDRANKKAEEEKAYKKERQSENKIKLEEKKKEDAIKLQNVGQILKPAYLMTKEEYEKEVTPLVQDYKKFARKNSKYLTKIEYYGLYEYTLQQILEDSKNGTLPDRSYLSRHTKDLEGIELQKQIIENFNYLKKRGFEDSEIHEEDFAPLDVVEKNKDYLQRLLPYFDKNYLLTEFQDDEAKSNKRTIKYHIDKDTYKTLMEAGDLTRQELLHIAQTVGVTIPSKVFKKEDLLKEKLTNERALLIQNAPKQNKEKLLQLISQIEEDFKPIEKDVFDKERERYHTLIKNIINKGTLNQSYAQNIPEFGKIFNLGELKRIKIDQPHKYDYEFSSVSLKQDWEKYLDAYLLVYVDSLKIKFVSAVIRNFERITLPIASFKQLKVVKKHGLFESEYRFDFINGSHFTFGVKAIGAGGYNIQVYHLRILEQFSDVYTSEGQKVQNWYSNILKYFTESNLKHGGVMSESYIECPKCGWKWKNDNQPLKKKYTCHMCGYDMLKSPSNIIAISRKFNVSIDFLNEQLKRAIGEEKVHTNNQNVVKIIALHHLDEDPNYYYKLSKAFPNNTNNFANGGELAKNKEFYKWYLNWFKGPVSHDMSIMFSLPSEFTRISKDSHDQIFLNVFEKNHEKVDAKKYLQELIDAADKFGVTMHLEPIPRTHKLKSQEHKDKITKDYLKSYYNKFGFNENEHGFMVKTPKLRRGGELNPDDTRVKSLITHKAGSAGGMLVGNRHSEGGIKAINKSTNQPLEMEGGEVVITRNAVSDKTKHEFEGKMMTNREILSKINQSGGGVSFDDGGEVKKDCGCKK